ncbi:hypothetical protein ACFSJY_02505 [Thalassotalea euphylliae]|uniref:hypothetical protein n=1 Tax=Thalassotalea euphylliae TaxID=1655234 RepID=UPI00363728F6
MKKLLLIATFVSSQVFAAPQHTQAIEDAAMQLNTPALVELSQTTEGYDQAFSQYRLAINYNLQAEQDKANEALKVAINTLEALTQQNENDDEAWALLSQSYGLMIAYQPMKAVFYGPKSGKALAKAKSLNNQNPRIFLVEGISDYHTPAMFGGSKERSVEALSQAISLYQSQAVNDYSWGEAEAYVWRGLANLELDNKEQALVDFAKATDIAPDYLWPQQLMKSHQ